MKTTNKLFISTVAILASSVRLFGNFEPEAPTKLRPAVAFASYFVNRDNYTGISDGALPREFGPDAMVRFIRQDEVSILQLRTAKTIVGWRVLESAVENIQDLVSADLNGDGKPDLVLVMESLGNGLGGSYSPVIVLLSSESSYSAFLLRSVFFNLSKFVILDNQDVGILQSDVLYGGVGADGNGHNYIVQRRLRITANLIVVDVGYAPKWVMYSFRPNHKETTQLSAEQKARVLEDSRNQWVFCALESQ